MRKLFLNLALLMATGFVAASVVPTAVAQNTPDMRVNIPFEFQVEGKTLAAGIYYVTVGTVYRRIDLVSDDGHRLMLSGTPARERNGNISTLVFHKYGDTYFLHEVMSNRQPFGMALPVSKAEKAMINIAGVQPVVETIAAGSR